MNRKALFLVGIGAISLAAAATQGVVLRRELKENTTEVYKIENALKQTVTLPGMGDQDMDLTSSMKLTLKTGKLDAVSGQADVESTISEIKTKADGAMAAALDQTGSTTPAEIKSSGKIDGRNHVVLTPPKTKGMMDMLVGSSSPAAAMMFVEFPEKAVNVGDTWTFELPKAPFFGAAPQSLNAKLTGEKDYNGAKVWVINVDGNIKIDFDMTEMLKNAPNNPMAGQKAFMKGSIDMKGEALVDKTSGKTLVYTTDAKTKSTMELPDAGVSIDTNGTSKTTLTLQK